MPEAAAIRKQLDRVRVVAIADALLLIPLVYCALTEREGVVNVLGPIHGLGFVLLMYLTARGAGEGRWGWWFPAVTLVTAGPPGSIIGEIKLRRDLAGTPRS